MAKETLPRFYVVEGIDGSGKTTFCESLQSSIIKSGTPCEIISESDDPAFHDLIRSLLKSDLACPLAEAYTFAAARANCINKMKKFKKAHPEGIVIFDRYIPSSLVYQTEKISASEVKHINENFPLPEVIFYLQITPEKALARIQKREEKEVEKYEKEDLLKKWAKKYNQVLLDNQNDLSFLPSESPFGSIAPNIGDTIQDSYFSVYKGTSTKVIVIDASKEPDRMIDQAFESYTII